ncbi:PAS domain S-box protein (plasmid) [Verrucomicrobiaceae bacterium 227]
MTKSADAQGEPSKIGRIFEATARAAGDKFLQALCDQLCVVLGVRFAWIGEFTGKGCRQLDPFSCSERGKPVTGVSFAREDTPCASLIDGGPWVFQGDLSARFPRDLFIRKHGIRSYVGIPLLSTEGGTLGVLTILHDEDLDELANVVRILEAFSARVSGELERLREHDKLIASEERFSTLLSNVRGMVYRCHNDRDWTMEFVTEGCFELTGYSPDELIMNQEASYGSLIHPDERDDVWEQVQKANASKSAYEVTYRIVLRDGSEKWVWEQGRAIQSPAGGFVLEGYIADITSQKLAEEALAESEERSSGVLKTAVDAIITMDEERRIESANPATEAMFGYSLEEMLGRNVKMLMPSPYREEHDGYVRNYVKTGERKIIGTGREVIAQRKDGSTFPIDLSVGEVRLARGRIFTGIIRDVTSRKQAENELRENEKRYRTLVAASTSTVWMTDPQGGFAAPQELWEAYTGQSWEGHRGNGWEEMIHPGDRERIGRSWAQALEKKSLYNVEGRVWCKSAEDYHYFEARAVPVKNDDGSVREWVGTMTDVHIQRSANEKLRESEERLSLAFEASNDCLWVYDMVGRQLVWNDAFEEIFAGGDDINAGDPLDWWTERIHADDRVRIRAGFNSAALDRETIRWQGECRFRMVNGEYATVLTRSVFVRDKEGLAVRSIGILQDISEQRAIDEALLRVSEDEKRRIGRNIHDDLCQQLFGIQCQAQILQEELGDAEHPEEASRVAEIVEMIGKANQSARQTAHGLAPVLLDSEGLVGALAQLARGVETAHAIRCDFGYEEDGPDCGRQETIQLYRITQEALRNAVQHGKADRIEVTLQKRGESWRLRIADNGLGLPDLPKGGMGILTMEHRARSIGAVFSLAPRKPQGAEIVCILPQGSHRDENRNTEL